MAFRYHFLCRRSRHAIHVRKAQAVSQNLPPKHPHRFLTFAILTPTPPNPHPPSHRYVGDERGVLNVLSYSQGRLVTMPYSVPPDVTLSKRQMALPQDM